MELQLHGSIRFGTFDCMGLMLSELVHVEFMFYWNCMIHSLC